MTTIQSKPPKRPPSELALLRYQVISAYLSLDPARGQRRTLLEALAAKRWPLPDGREVTFAAETLRGWVRRFRRSGLAGLEDAPRAKPGVKVLSPDEQQLICNLKRDVPSRSIERVIDIATTAGKIPAGRLSRSTVHRVLRQQGLSKRIRRTPVGDIDRFEAAAPNDMWQSDMMKGPWLPDPTRPGKRRQAWLHAFLDDHSRLLLAGRWSFHADLPTLELVFREALRRHGLPKRVYYDNGGPYRSKHMAQIVAVLSEQRPIFTQPYRPEGHGKIEAFNRHCRAAFVDEVRASNISDLDGLNRAFRAWVDLKYNRRVHGETGQTPWDRWRSGVRDAQSVSEHIMREAFMFRAKRTTDKAGVLKLFNLRYQTGPALAKRRVELRFDPERMEKVEVWHDGKFHERIGPLQVGTHRRATPKPKAVIGDDDASEGCAVQTPEVDWLGVLTDMHTPAALGDDGIEKAIAERREQDDAVVELLRVRLTDDAFDAQEVRRFLDRHGPFDLAALTDAVDLAVEVGGADQHVGVLLSALLRVLAEVS